MITKSDEYGKKYKEPETAEEYLILEIARLKEENERLTHTILDLKRDENKYLSFIIDESVKECDYLVEIGKDGFGIKKVEEKNE